MKATLKTKYDVDKNGATSTLAVNTGAVKLQASITDATIINGPSLNGLAFSVEKPGFFIVDYKVPEKDFRFQFMNTVNVAEKPLNLTYIHNWADNRTFLDGTLVFDSANKVSAKHALGSKNCKLKYTYVHEEATTFEPSYDVAENSWEFAVSRKVYGDDVFKGTYHTRSKVLGLEWTRNLKSSGNFKVVASVNMADESKRPKVIAESTWNFEV